MAMPKRRGESVTEKGVVNHGWGRSRRFVAGIGALAWGEQAKTCSRQEMRD
jgi:hypothetical protein